MAQDITLDTVIGLAGTDTLDVGVPIEFRFRVSNSSGNTYYGATNGFRLYSTTGATWFPHIYYDTTIVTVPAVDTIVDTTYYGRWADNIYIDSIWDGGYFVNFYSDHDDSALTPDLFDQGSDTIGFGGYQQSKWGLYDDFDDIMFTIKLDSISTLSGRKTICLDSAFYRPSGYWRWSDPDTIASWDGPHCFAIKRELIQGFGESGGGEEELASIPIENTDEIESAYRYFESFPSSRYSINEPRINYDLVGIHRDERGMVHVRFQQRYKDLEVVGRHVIVHFTSWGEISSVNGICEKVINLETASSALSSAEAATIALSHSFSDSAISEKIVFVDAGVPKLAWRVMVYTLGGQMLQYIIEDSSAFIRYHLDVSKEFTIDNECLSASGDGHLRHWTDLIAMKDTVAGAIGWYLFDHRRMDPNLADTILLQSCMDGGASGQMMVTGIEMHFDTGSLGESRPVFTDIVDGDTLVLIQSSGNPDYFKTAADAFFYTGETYDWLLQSFGYNSWYNKGGKMKVVAVDDDPNSFGKCRQVGDLPSLYVRCFLPCDPNLEFPLPASPHVMAHEWAHAIVTNTSGVPGDGSSGKEGLALSEGWPVMMGEAFKHWLPDSLGPQSILWKPGSYIYKQGASFDYAFNCIDPDDASAASKGAAYYSDTGECGDILFDPDSQTQLQTILHKWFQLLSDGQDPPCTSIASFDDIGIDLAADLVFSANCDYWTPNIGFVDAAIWTCRAAKDMDATLYLPKRANEAWELVGVLKSFDTDSDGYWDAFDNCPNTANPSQEDTDKDWIGDACCCTNRGDIDHNGEITIADVTYMIGYMFRRGPAPPCPEEANAATESAGVDISDLTTLVSYLYKSGPSLDECE